jgi:hypothetical protein
MNRKVILTALALLLAATTVSAQNVSFTSLPPVAGQTEWTESASYETSIQSVADTKTANTSRTVDRAKTCRVLAIDGAGRIDSVAVTYSASSNPAVNGRSYVVTPNNVSYATGGTPPPQEAQFVRADNAGFGQFRAIDKIFGGQTFTINRSFSPNRNFAEELLNVANGMQLSAISLTLRSVTDGVARFDLSMTVESSPKVKKNAEAAPGGMNMVLNGTLDVTTATSRPVLLDVAGNINAVTKNKKNGATAGSATGSTAIRIEYAF